MRAMLVLLAVTAGVQAQPDPLTQAVLNCYRQYLGREPNPQEVFQHVQELRAGKTIADKQADFLGSEEFFNRHGRNPALFIRGIYGAVLNRLPKQQELIPQTQVLASLGGNRTHYARQFLDAAQAELNNRPQFPQPLPPRIPSQELIAAANRLVFAAQSEIRPTFQNRRFLAMTRQYVNATEALHNTIMQGNPLLIQQVIQQVTIQHQALQQEANLIAPFAASTQSLLAECGNLLQIIATGGAIPVGPVITPPIRNALNSLPPDARALMQRCQNTQLLYPQFHGYANTMQALLNEVDTIAQFTRVGRPTIELIPHLQFARQYQANLNRAFQDWRFDRTFRSIWSRLDQNLDQLGVWLNVPLPPAQPMPPLPPVGNLGR